MISNKQKITLTIDADLYLKIKMNQMNISKTVNDYLKEFLEMNTDKEIKDLKKELEEVKRQKIILESKIEEKEEKEKEKNRPLTFDEQIKLQKERFQEEQRMRARGGLPWEK